MEFVLGYLAGASANFETIVVTVVACLVIGVIAKAIGLRE